jgi:tRNA/tmRNA/rRNA uracil-C5-methylase (TrmA/RlmC/RlmD family)
VIGIDGDRAAVRDARHNLRRLPWARIHHGDVAALLAGGTVPTGEAGLAVLDPPRAGAGRAVIERLLRPPRPGGRHPRGPQPGGPQPGSPQPGGPQPGGRDRRLRRVAYVSCDPATLARDIAVFGELGWEMAGLRAFDAFPMTHHLECVATLAPGD